MTSYTAKIEESPVVLGGKDRVDSGVRRWIALLLVSFMLGLMSGLGSLILWCFSVLGVVPEGTMNSGYGFALSFAVFPLFILAATCLECLELKRKGAALKVKQRLGRTKQ